MLGVFPSILLYMTNKDAVDTPTIILYGIALTNCIFISRKKQRKFYHVF